MELENWKLGAGDGGVAAIWVFASPPGNSDACSSLRPLLYIFKTILQGMYYTVSQMETKGSSERLSCFLIVTEPIRGKDGIQIQVWVWLKSQCLDGSIYITIGKIDSKWKFAVCQGTQTGVL